jgi:hypothetical protein
VHTGFLLENLKGRDHLEDLGHRWEDSIIMDLREVGRERVDWIHLAQDRNQWWSHMNIVMNLWIPQKAGNLLTS